MIDYLRPLSIWDKLTSEDVQIRATVGYSTAEGTLERRDKKKEWWCCAPMVASAAADSFLHRIQDFNLCNEIYEFWIIN